MSGEGVRRLSKSDLLQGRDQVHYVYFEELGGEIPLRPLTDGQWAQIQAIKSSGGILRGRPVMDADGDIDMSKTELALEIDVAKASEKDYEADALTVMYALADGSRWTLEDVKQLRPAGIVQKIAKKVREISGVLPEQLSALESFRRQSGGSGNRDSAPSGVSASG